MSTALVKRPIPPARDPANKVTIESMRVAVSELSGIIGSQMQRAVRVCELVDAGILEFKSDGTVGRPGDGLPYELDQSLKFVGPGLRILGDMSNPTISKRLMLQTSTPNGNTVVSAIPNGSAGITAFAAFNSSDPDNSGVVQFRMDPTAAVINSQKTGTGTTRDLTFTFDGVEKMRLSPSGPLLLDGFFATKGTQSGLQLYGRTSGTAEWVQYSDTGSLRFFAGGADKALIDSAGNFYCRDLHADRQDGTGVVFLNNASTRYVYWDGTNYTMPGGNVFANNIELGFRDWIRVTGGFERGKVYAINAGVTLGTSSAGHVFFIYNDSGAAVTLTQGGGLTLRLAGTATTGNRTLAQRGFATLWFNTATDAAIFGNVT